MAATYSEKVRTVRLNAAHGCGPSARARARQLSPNWSSAATPKSSAWLAGS